MRNLLVCLVLLSAATLGGGCVRTYDMRETTTRTISCDRRIVIAQGLTEIGPWVCSN